MLTGDLLPVLFIDCAEADNKAFDLVEDVLAELFEHLLMRLHSFEFNYTAIHCLASAIIYNLRHKMRVS